MTTPLDLQEQEQLDDIKAFWKQYGNLITWVLVAALGGYAAWNGWQLYQRKQSEQAGAMFDELERAASAGDADKAQRVFGDLKERYPRTAQAQQGALLAAKTLADKGKPEEARAALTWVAEHGIEDEAKVVAKIRLAGVLLDARKFDEALALLDAAKGTPFEALAADRRGDIQMAAGRKADAVVAFKAAWEGLPETTEYRRVVEAKLTALGAAPGAAAPGAAASASASASGARP